MIIIDLASSVCHYKSNKTTTIKTIYILIMRVKWKENWKQHIHTRIRRKAKVDILCYVST